MTKSIAGLTAALAILAAVALAAYLGHQEGIRAGESRAEWWRYESMIHQGEAAFCKEVIGDAAEQAAAERAWQ